MINAIIQNNNGETLVWEFPGNIYELYHQFRSIGIQKPPSGVKLTDDEDAPIRVKLYAESELGNHLIRLLSEKHNLEDVEAVTSIVENARDIIKEDLEQEIINDQYSTPDELYDDIRQMLYDAGSVSVTFYFPLSGRIYDVEYGEDYQISNAHLQTFESEIREKFEIYMKRDAQNMAEYFDGSGKEKMLLADWGFVYIGDELYGKVDVRLTESMTPEEKENLKDWICGQNSDGLGEGFEQQDIETEDGTLYVSFWDSGNDYFIYDQEEMNLHIGGQLGQQFGGVESKYPLLIGRSVKGNKRLHSIQEVADFICTHGQYGDLTITQEDGTPFLDTFGIYINRISDMEYREELLKVLVPMQMRFENETFDLDCNDEDIQQEMGGM